ncbi:DNA-binding transcriptional regulator, PucR family [Bacillus sp. OV322]|uniref:helix-turn-helix domain-containing protein n=1 Tax=Bacillus sp. OV322 TaxID=1882764 RepID=UPI0008EFEE0A|nr:helix-turn-helix domain-containing protein [Bacillus sp. OV322]SFB92977.1 DNA-binding transcriptional regulator, PucR family [Bacillus sp. OV322]
MKNSNKNRDIFKGLFGDLMEFADRISSVLGCPVTIEDNNHRLLAYSMHEDTTDKARISTIIGKRVPEKVINSLWKDGIIPALLKEDMPIKVQAITEVGLGSRAAVSIRKQNEVLGFIWALQVDRPFSDEDLEFLQQAAREAKNQLQQHHLKKKQLEAGNQEFLWRLLTGHFKDEEEVQEHLSHFPLHSPYVLSVIVFEFPEEITRDIERNISYMLLTTQKTKVYYYTIDQNKLILLAGTEKKENFISSLYEFVPYFIMEMKNRFAVKDIMGAAGNVYQLLSQSMHSYQEALYTLKMKHAFPKDTADMILYEQLGIFRTLDYLVSGKHNQQEHSSLSLLKEYDAKNATGLLETLLIYLEKDCHPNEAAKSLHVHANTLNYRLKRISEVAHINLRDPLQKMSLFLHLKTEQYKEFLMKP